MIVVVGKKLKGISCICLDERFFKTRFISDNDDVFRIKMTFSYHASKRNLTHLIFTVDIIKAFQIYILLIAANSSLDNSKIKEHSPFAGNPVCHLDYA